jgi:hypothetical protein
MLLACQPKSGSTFLSRYLAQLSGGRTYSFVPDYGRREQELSERRLLRAKLHLNPLLVGQHHVRHSAWTQRLVDRYGVGVVVLTRNLFDVVASYRDHVRNEDTVGPVVYLEKRMVEVGDDELEMFVARFAIPWYLNFYMSWRSVEGVMFADYEDIVADADGLARRALDRFGVPAKGSVEDVAAVRAKSRFNKGVPGRGRDISAEARRIVMEQAAFYARFHDDPYLVRHLGEG